MTEERDRLLCWDPEATALRPGHQRTGAPAVADSWLVEDGRVRALDRHLARFEDSCRRTPGGPPGGVGFLAAVSAHLPREGRWFPRIEMHTSPTPTFALRLRPAPPQAGPARLWVLPGPDPRTRPTVKGPDLGLLTSLREQAVQAGASEALILGRDGSVLEGALSSVLWWRDSVLHAPPPDAPLLPGVTRDVLLELAGQDHVTVRRTRAPLQELDGAEVWLTSALHGIRPVVGRIAPGVQAATPQLAGPWNTRLSALGRPVPTDLVQKGT